MTEANEVLSVMVRPLAACGDGDGEAVEVISMIMARVGIYKFAVQG